VISTVSLVPTNLVFGLSGTTLALSWPADHTGWRLLMQTNNLASGLSLDTNDWTTVTDSSSTNQLTLPMDSIRATEFFRMVYP